MEVQEFIDTCKQVFPDCRIEGTRNKRSPCLLVYTDTFGPYVAHLWDKHCCAWEKTEGIADKEDYTVEEFMAKLERVKLSYGL